ncbi:hypothetical protein Y032_0112g296 [Ancylostoma ceylanicum]|uniref:Uncharacterized protein n=1 Tax=Ancylostoma ceylanicum TaxID=53326 RepID=A0A016TDX1_9BILA|nr:hypothetical protein Y032_0112g296 [Ancylostoma ceylanicum]
MKRRGHEEENGVRRARRSELVLSRKSLREDFCSWFEFVVVASRAYTGSFSVKAQFRAHPAILCPSDHHDLPAEIIDDTTFLVDDFGC